MESRVLGEIPKGSIEPLRVIGPARWRDRLSGSLVFNYCSEESIPTRVPDEAWGLAGKGIESLIAGSPKGIFQIDDSAKRTILANIERQPFARIRIQPIFDRVGGGHRAVPRQRGQPYRDRLTGGLGDPAQQGERWLSLSSFDFGDGRLGDTSHRGQVALSQIIFSPQPTKDCARFGLSIHGCMIPDNRSYWTVGAGPDPPESPDCHLVPPPLPNPLFGWYRADINRIPGSRLDVTAGHRLERTSRTIQPRTLNPQVSGSNPVAHTVARIPSPAYRGAHFGA